MNVTVPVSTRRLQATAVAVEATLSTYETIVILSSSQYSMHRWSVVANFGRRSTIHLSEACAPFGHAEVLR